MNNGVGGHCRNGWQMNNAHVLEGFFGMPIERNAIVNGHAVPALHQADGELLHKGFKSRVTGGNAA
jgi:hypothetical protein